MSDVAKKTPVTSFKQSEILDLLEQGMSRKEIAEHYGQSVAYMARTVWTDPVLKNRKAKTQDVFTMVKDVEEVAPAEAPALIVNDNPEEVAAPIADVDGSSEGIADNSTNNWGQ